MHAYSKPLGSVTARSSRISYFTNIGMAMAIPAILLLPALDIQGLIMGYTFIGYFSLYIVAKSKKLTLVP